MCRVLEVSRSEFYAWINRADTVRAMQEMSFPKVTDEQRKEA